MPRTQECSQKEKAVSAEGNSIASEGVFRMFFKIWNTFHKIPLFRNHIRQVFPFKGEMFEVLYNYERVNDFYMMPEWHFYLINLDQYQAGFALENYSDYLNQLTRIQGKWTVFCYRESENGNKDDRGLRIFFFFLSFLERVKVLMLLILDLQLLVTHCKQSKN